MLIHSAVGAEILLQGGHQRNKCMHRSVSIQSIFSPCSSSIKLTHKFMTS